MKLPPLVLVLLAALSGACVDRITATLELGDCPAPWPVFSAADSIPGTFDLRCPFWWIDPQTGDTVANIFGRIPDLSRARARPPQLGAGSIGAPPEDNLPYSIGCCTVSYLSLEAGDVLNHATQFTREWTRIRQSLLGPAGRNRAWVAAQLGVTADTLGRWERRGTPSAGAAPPRMYLLALAGLALDTFRRRVDGDGEPGPRSHWLAGDQIDPQWVCVFLEQVGPRAAWLAGRQKKNAPGAGTDSAPGTS